MTLDIKARQVFHLRLDNGRCPFEDWIGSLGSNLAIAVDARIVRIRDGNFGDHKSIGDGVFELRVPKGPGLRVYYGMDGDDVVILISGGNKNTQSRDIKKAKMYWKEYKK